MSNWCNFCQVWHAAGCNHPGRSTEQQPDPMHYITALSNRVKDLALKVYAKPDWHTIGPSLAMHPPQTDAERIALLENMVAVRDDLLRQDKEHIAALEELIRVGGVIKKGGDAHEWEIWSDLHDAVVVATHSSTNFNASTHERFGSVLQAAAEVLRRWQTEAKP